MKTIIDKICKTLDNNVVLGWFAWLFVTVAMFAVVFIFAIGLRYLIGV